MNGRKVIKAESEARIRVESAKITESTEIIVGETNSTSRTGISKIKQRYSLFKISHRRESVSFSLSLSNGLGEWI